MDLICRLPLRRDLRQGIPSNRLYFACKILDKISETVYNFFDILLVLKRADDEDYSRCDNDCGG